MEKILFREDRQMARDIELAWDQQKETLQQIVDLYNVLGLAALSAGELHPLFNDTVNFLFDKLTGGSAQLAIGGEGKKTYLPLNREHAMNILEKPVGYQALLDAITTHAQNCIKGVREGNDWFARYPVSAIGQYFDIDEDGALQFSERTLNEIVEAGRSYLRSDKGANMFRFAQDVVASYYKNGMDSGYSNVKDNDRIFAILGEVVERLDDTNKTFTANYSFTKLDRDFTELESHTND